MASTSPNRTFLKRTVYHDEAYRGRVELNALDLWKEALPIVLIGDPGMGKSYLTEALVDANPAAKLVKAGAELPIGEVRLIAPKSQLIMVRRPKCGRSRRFQRLRHGSSAGWKGLMRPRQRECSAMSLRVGWASLSRIH